MNTDHVIFPIHEKGAALKKNILMLKPVHVNVRYCIEK
jgi:hypothetical protein